MFTASSDLQVWLRERNPPTCSQLVDMADAYQLAHKHSNMSQYQKEGGISMQGQNKYSQSRVSYQKQQTDGIRKCFFYGSPEHMISNCPEKKVKDSKSKTSYSRPGNDGGARSLTSALLLPPEKKTA